jgi:N-acetylneuraminate synthase/N,N'-diacetyllegionaminate synthase
MKIGDRRIGSGAGCLIIAEAGVNHNGEVRLAEELIDLAAEAGVDAVKFQTFVTDNVESRHALKPSYFAGREETESKRDFSRRLELPVDALPQLKERSEARGLIFLSTACDTIALDILVDLGVDALKIGSSDTDNFPLLRKAAATGLPIFLSTGISTMDEVGASVEELRANGCEDLVVLQCTSNYPIAPADVNLRAMQTFAEQLGCEVGFSDHTEGTWAAVAATALGAAAIEKHFTISRDLAGVDHPASAEPDELARLVSEVRATEAALGDGIKQVMRCEAEHLETMRKSLVAARDLERGRELTTDDLLVKRPGGGIKPSRIDEVLGRRLTHALEADDLLHWDDLEA